MGEYDRQREARSVSCFFFRLFTSSLLCGRRNDTSQVISTLQTLKSVFATLSAISGMVESAIPELSREFMPHMQQAGMASFPDEILASIFEYAFEFAGRDRDKVTNSIACVCRRYRQIAVRTPKLWTFMKFMARRNMDPELYLTLSRGKALAVEIDCDSFSSTEELIAIMHSIKPAVHRLEELTIRAMEEKPHTSSFLTHLHESYDEVDFCALKMLRLEYWEPEWTFDSDLADDDAEEAEELKKMFFKSWKIPALRELALSNHIPTDNFVSTMQLTHLHLTFGSDWDQGKDGEHSSWDTDLIVDFLRSFDESEILKELSIKLILIEFQRREDNDPVSLPSVSKLKIDVEGVWPDQFVRLANAWQFPNVEHLDLRFWMYTEEHFHDWFVPFFDDFFSGPSFGGRNLKSLCLSVEVDESHHTGVTRMLEQFPDLRSLTLKGNFPLPESNLGQRLETLRIEDSPRINRDFLNLIKDTSECGTKLILRNVEIVNCPSIDDKAFRDNLLVGTELVWRSDTKVCT